MTASTICTREKSEDILQEIPEQDLPLLKNVYEFYREQSPQIYALIINCINWKRNQKKTVDFSVYCVRDDDWVKSGTFVFLWEYSSSNIFVSTLKQDLISLYTALAETKRIKWAQKRIWMLVPNNCISTVIDVLQDLKPPNCRRFNAALWRLENETALQFQIEYPDDIYVKKLDKTHAEVVNKHWSHNHNGSIEYLTALIDVNVAFGVFHKSDDSLLCWVLRNHYGVLCNLQTVPEYVRKGYATLIVKVMAKYIAQNEDCPICCIIIEGNVRSQSFFGNAGFRKSHNCMFVESF